MQRTEHLHADGEGGARSFAAAMDGSSCPDQCDPGREHPAQPAVSTNGFIFDSCAAGGSEATAVLPRIAEPSLGVAAVNLANDTPGQAQAVHGRIQFGNAEGVVGGQILPIAEPDRRAPRAAPPAGRRRDLG